MSLNLKKEDFYNWAYSDLLVNNRRGHLAEYIIKVALDANSNRREEWDDYDLEYNDFKIEIKSSAYIQSWKQNNFSKIIFDISPKKYTDPKTNVRSKEPKRISDIYVFCHLKHKERETINPLDTSQWEFYIVETTFLDEKFPEQKKISLSVLKKNGIKPIDINDIKNIIDYNCKSC